MRHGTPRCMADIWRCCGTGWYSQLRATRRRIWREPQKHGATVMGYHGEFEVSFRARDHRRQMKCVLASAISLLSGEDAVTATRAAVREFEAAADTSITGNAEDRVIASLVYRGNADGIRVAGKNR